MGFQLSRARNGFGFHGDMLMLEGSKKLLSLFSMNQIELVTITTDIINMAGVWKAA